MDKRSGKSKKKNPGSGSVSNTKTCQFNGQGSSDSKSKTTASTPINHVKEAKIETKYMTNGDVIKDSETVVKVLNESNEINSGLPNNTSPTNSEESVNEKFTESPNCVTVIEDKISRLELSNGEVERSDTSNHSRIPHSADKSVIDDRIHGVPEDLNRDRQNLQGSTGHNVVKSDESHTPISDNAETITTGIGHQSEHNEIMSNGLSQLKDISNTSNESQIVPEENDDSIHYISYESELQMSSIMKLIQKDLSEPYSVYTYRYFIHNWPKLCFLAMDGDSMVGVIVCKLDVHKQINKRGYIAMLAVDERYRRRKIGSNLVLKSIRAMVDEDADEIVLETEITNKSALRLYENLGFVRDKRLFRYYLNGVDALRLKLWLK